MAGKIECVTGAMSTSTGNNDFTSSGFGTVTGVIYMIGHVGGSWTAGVSGGFGFFDGTTNRWNAWSGEHNQARGDNSTDRSTSTTITLLDETGAVVATGVVSLITDGFRINWSDAPDSAHNINILLFGGDITTDVHDIAPSATENGTASKTGLASQPQALIFLRSKGSTNLVADAALSLGVATDESGGIVQRCFSFFANDNNAAGVDPYQAFFNNRAGSAPNNNTTWVTYEVTAFNSDGYTLTTRDGAQSADQQCLAIWGLADFALLDTNVPTSTGNQTHTPSFETAGLLAVISGMDTANTESDAENWCYSYGVASGTGSTVQGIIGGVGEDATDPTDTASINRASVIVDSREVDTGDAAIAAVSSITSTTVVYNYTTVDTARQSDLGFTLFMSTAAGATTNTKTTSLNALIQKTGILKTASLDSLVQKTGITLTTNADALIQKQETLSAQLDSMVQKLESLTAQIDAMIQLQGITATTSLDSLIVKQTQLNASIDALIQKQELLTASIDALILKQGITLSTSLDAVVVKQLTLNASMDAIIQKQELLTASMDSLILKQGVTANTSMDSLVQLQNIDTEFVDLDAMIQIQGVPLTNNLDAVIQKQNINITSSLDSIISLLITKQLSIDSLVLKQGELLLVGLNAIIGEVDIGSTDYVATFRRRRL